MARSGLSKADYQALAGYHHAIRRFLRSSETAARDAGLTPQHYFLLLAVQGYPGKARANITQLAERLQLDHHSTGGLVDRAQERGLVTRQLDHKDRRRVYVALTLEGVAVLRHLASIHAREVTRMHLDLTPPHGVVST